MYGAFLLLMIVVLPIAAPIALVAWAAHGLFGIDPLGVCE